MNAQTLHHIHELDIIVPVKAAPDQAAVFAILVDEGFDRSAMSDVAHSIAAHEELLTGVCCLLEDEPAAWSRACSVEQPGCAGADHDLVVDLTVIIH